MVNTGIYYHSAVNMQQCSRLGERNDIEMNHNFLKLLNKKSACYFSERSLPRVNSVLTVPYRPMKSSQV